MPLMRQASWVKFAAIASALWVAFAVPQAAASTSAVMEVHQLLEQGKTQDAAQRIQSHLKTNAGDVQMRFMQGVVAAELQKYDQAIQIFTALTKEYPGLPEPYNNLAVLYAARGEDRKAAQVLEQAIGTNPSYATAHENLGDLYARMASDAYTKALQLDSNRKAITPKLSLIKQIFPSASAPGVVAASSAAPVPTLQPVAPAEPVLPPPTLAPSAPVIATTPTAVTPSVAETPKTAPAPAAEKTAASKAEPEIDAEQQRAVQAIEKAVQSWAKAWAQQDMNGYYAAYSSRFDPQGGTLANWKKERKERIVGRPTITVQVRDLKVSVRGDRASASFVQYYASGTYKATTFKTLRMQRENSAWRIIREETGR